MQTALFIGRFQPFHKGHIDAIKQILSENDALYLAIGSINEVGTERNPLDVENRIKLIIESLKIENIGRIQIFLVPDFNNDVKWKKFITENIPPFDIVYSGTNETLDYFKDTHKTKLVKINIPISATLIRKEIKENNPDWKNWTYLDEKTAKLIAKGNK